MCCGRRQALERGLPISNLMENGISCRSVGAVLQEYGGRRGGGGQEGAEESGVLPALGLEFEGETGG